MGTGWCWRAAHRKRHQRAGGALDGASRPPRLRIDPLRAGPRRAGGRSRRSAFAAEHHAETVLIYATTTPGSRSRRVQAELGVERAGHLVEAALAGIAAALKASWHAPLRGGRRRDLRRRGASRSPCRSLRIGTQIAPGVPATVDAGRRATGAGPEIGQLRRREFLRRGAASTGSGAMSGKTEPRCARRSAASAPASTSAATRSAPRATSAPGSTTAG